MIMIKFTKEEMMLYAWWMACTDLKATPFTRADMLPEEAHEVWVDGLIMKHDGKDVCVIPDKSDDELKLCSFTMDDHYLLDDYDWVPTDEELIAELKRRYGKFKGYHGDPGELKWVIERKWPEALEL